MTRIPFDPYYVTIFPNDTLILKGRGGKERRIPPSKWWINRNTPVGEEADLYERKPYGGKRLINWDEVIALETDRDELDENET